MRKSTLQLQYWQDYAPSAACIPMRKAFKQHISADMSLLLTVQTASTAAGANGASHPLNRAIIEAVCLSCLSLIYAFIPDGSPLPACAAVPLLLLLCLLLLLACCIAQQGKQPLCCSLREQPGS
jgi:hypothetical protein